MTARRWHGLAPDVNPGFNSQHQATVRFEINVEVVRSGGLAIGARALMLATHRLCRA